MLDGASAKSVSITGRSERNQTQSEYERKGQLCTTLREHNEKRWEEWRSREEKYEGETGGMEISEERRGGSMIAWERDVVEMGRAPRGTCLRRDASRISNKKSLVGGWLNKS